MAARAYEVVLNELLQKIKNGQMQKGSRFQAEREMAAEYGVSRGSLREALRILERDGYVQSIPGGGRILIRGKTKGEVVQNMTNRLSTISLQEYFELRECLDIAVVVKACERATPEDIARIQSAIEASDRSFVNPDDRTMADNQVNVAIAKAAHNTLLEEIYSMTYELIPLVRIRSLRTAVGRSDSMKEHLRILEAIQDRDVLSAQMAVRLHNKNILKRLKIEKGTKT